MKSKYNNSKFIAIVTIGLVESLENGIICLNEAEHILFSPATIELLQKFKYDQEIIDIIHLGTELEDIYSIIPQEYNNSINKLKLLSKKYLKNKYKYYYSEQKIIKKILSKPS